MNDDKLFDLVRQSIGPAPAFVRESGLVAWDWRDPESDLLRLVEDSRTSTQLRTAAVHEYMLVWVSKALEMTITVRLNPTGFDDLVVAVESFGDSRGLDSATLRVEMLQSGELRTLAPKHLGDGEVQFSVDTNELIRIAVSLDGRVDVATGWFRPIEIQMNPT